MLLQVFGNGNIKPVDSDVSPFVKILEAENGKLEIEQTFFGPGAPIYYTKQSDVLFISDSLKKLKEYTELNCELNVDMLSAFFYNGFISGTHTLIKGVYKLPLCSKASIHKGKIDVRYRELHRHSEFGSQCVPKCPDDKFIAGMIKAYDNALHEIVAEMLPDSSASIAMAMSGGYDSNCLLHYVKKISPKMRVSAICVGEYRGTDERKVAKEIAATYEDVRLLECAVSPDTLDRLDEIVSRLEGCVYERGIFLQYELAAKLAQSGVSALLCGECADQVFHTKSYAETNSAFLYDYLNTPREMAAYVILPKSFMMLRSFGIQGLYPFLDKRIIAIGHDTAAINGCEKKFHKAFCRQILPDRIFSKLSKRGGSTSLRALFNSEIDVEKGIRESRYYDPNFRITQKYPPDEALMDYYLSLKYIESFERQFCD